MAEVIVKLDGGQEVASAIILDSVRGLGLKLGVRGKAVVKATEALLATDE